MKYEYKNIRIEVEGISKLIITYFLYILYISVFIYIPCILGSYIEALLGLVFLPCPALPCFTIKTSIFFKILI